ncbi:family 78 glycoside hydrolase catalytic domain [Companilactobacillus sp. HBUAS56275]|uniref:alpha-L-rhamnosidase n=1 Tax=Candidatus Companilactobacillus pullicola TaxID=2838523 RepID=A0A9D1ZLK6_9LACO|nr:family 78 glycoside hydrolase catalytic domain [Candidatus Companilactobacillus pullicola]
MEISRVEINHMDKPLGFNLDNHLHITGYLNEAYSEKIYRKLIIKAHNKIVYQTEWEMAQNLIFDFPFTMQARTHYQVELLIKTGDQKLIKHSTWFETGYLGQKMKGHWIGFSDKNVHSIVLSKTFTTYNVEKARLYITGLGLYEAYLDGKKVGNEFLTPGFTDYNYYTQLNTYDVSTELFDGEHKLEIMLADGWYKGKIGLKEHGGVSDNYGDRLMSLADLRIIDQSGAEHIISTDESWQVLNSPITHSGIYYGEDINLNKKSQILGTAINEKSINQHLLDRLSLPIKKHEHFNIKKTIHTNNGDTVLDFGQNFAGWIEFKDLLKKGDKGSIEFGEIMQNGEFYRNNLRSARAEFTYISDGLGKTIHPHFTYFGFRYARLKGFPKDIEESNFTGIALYSDMSKTGTIETSNKDVNRLFENVKWGQKSNFIDIPTDCPQRDERLGWTGDAAIFAKTASYNMNTFEFFRKFSFDIAVEQSKNNGFVPLYVPAPDQKDGGKAVWGDASTIIPWNTYQRTGDKAVLQQNIGAMMSWVDWIHERAIKNNNEYLWLGDDQLGDWLALDTEDIMKLKGKTPDDLIASAYYYHSSKIVSQATETLKMKHEAQYYGQLAKLVKEAFIKHFFTVDGLPLANTQTGLAICLQFNLYPEGSRDILINNLVNEIEKDDNHLATGFVGTPLLLPALSENNQNDLALRIFLNNDFPSWLYEVKLGATTIWERWNSVKPNGEIAENGMNSLNHYSAGSVMGWAYEYLLGIKQTHNDAVFKPIINAKISEIKGQCALPTGILKVAWKLVNANKVEITLSIPFGSKTKVSLPRADKIWINNKIADNNIILSAGNYEISYVPTKPITNTSDVHTPLKEFIGDKILCANLKELVPFWDFLEISGNMERFKKYSLYQLSQEMRGIGFKPFNQKQINQINDLFQKSLLEGNQK